MSLSVIAQPPFQEVAGCWLPLGNLFVGLFLGSVALFIVTELHADWLVEKKGFDDPLPLSKTEGGWAPSGPAQAYDLMLGPLREARARASARGAGGAAAGMGVGVSMGMGMGLIGVGGEGQRPLGSAEQGLGTSAAASARLSSTSGGAISDHYDSGYDSAVFNDLFDQSTAESS